MPVFGADPDAPQKEWEEEVPRRPRTNRVINDLLNYFGYHKDMRMSQRFNDHDRTVLATNLSRRIKQGFTPESLRSTIDRFYQTYAGASEYPAMLFCKSEIQRALLEEEQVTKDDAVLSWLVDGMPSDGPFTDSREARKAVLLCCDESLMRYPEVVAEILRMDDPEPHLSERLTALEDIILWNLENSDEGTGHARDVLANINLPKELASTVRSPKSMRDKHATVNQAVASIPNKKQESKW